MCLIVSLGTKLVRRDCSCLLTLNTVSCCHDSGGCGGMLIVGLRENFDIVVGYFEGSAKENN